MSDQDIGVAPDYLEDVFGVSAYPRGISTYCGFTARAPSGTDLARTRRILVADDNGDAAALLAVLLELEGNEVQIAANGAEAVSRAESFRPEVMLMDLNLPGIDGCEASRRIRARPWGKTMLIVALTGLGQSMDRGRAQAAGVDMHFSKPVDTTTLLSVVARSLHRGPRVDLP